MPLRVCMAKCPRTPLLSGHLVQPEPREGQSGADLQLTIDSKLQNFVQARLGSESAAVVIMDCENGDLVANASSPSYDPNLFIGGISSADYNPLLQSEYRPLVNKTVQGTYPPGSTYKMVVAMAALEEGIVGPEAHRHFALAVNSNELRRGGDESTKRSAFAYSRQRARRVRCRTQDLLARPDECHNSCVPSG